MSARALGAGVRDVEAAAAVSKCQAATAMRAAGVEHRAVLAGTDDQRSLMRSRIAFQRGILFEKMMEEPDAAGRGFASLRAALAPIFGIGADGIDARRALEVDAGHFDTAARWAATLAALEELATGVLVRPLALSAVALLDEEGTAREADVLVLDPTTEPPRVVIGEAKSWPVLDGRNTDPTGAGKALAQCGIYAVMLTSIIAAHPSLSTLVVARHAVLINPVNTGFHPVARSYDITAATQRAGELLAALAARPAGPGSQTLKDLGGEIDNRAAQIKRESAQNGDGDLAERERNAARRVELAHAHLDAVPSHFDLAVCSLACGLVNLCHTRARSADLVVALESPAADVAGIATVTRVLELAGGAQPRRGEAASAQRLRLASSLLDEAEARP